MFPVGSCSSSEDDDVWILQNPNNLPLPRCQQQQQYVQKALVPRSRGQGLSRPTSASSDAFPVVHRTRTASAETGNDASDASISITRRAKYRSVIPAWSGNSTFDSDLELDLERFACSEPVATRNVRVDGTSVGSTRDGFVRNLSTSDSSARDRNESRSRHREPKVPRNISCSSSGSEEDGPAKRAGVSRADISSSWFLKQTKSDKCVARNVIGFELGSYETARLGTRSTGTWNGETGNSGVYGRTSAQSGTAEQVKNALAAVPLEPDSLDFWNRTEGKPSINQISGTFSFDTGTSGTNRSAGGLTVTDFYGAEITGNGSAREHRIKTTISSGHLGFPLPLSSPDESRFEPRRLNGGQSGHDGLVEECSSPCRKSLGSTSDQADQEKIVRVFQTVLD